MFTKWLNRFPTPRALGRMGHPATTPGTYHCAPTGRMTPQRFPTLSGLTVPEGNGRGQGEKSSPKYAPATMRKGRCNLARVGMPWFSLHVGEKLHSELGRLHTHGPAGQASSPNTLQFQRLVPRIFTSLAFPCVAIVDQPSQSSGRRLFLRPRPGSPAGRAAGRGRRGLLS